MPWWGGGGASQKDSGSPPRSPSAGSAALDEARGDEEQLRAELEAKAGPSLAAWEAAKAELDRSVLRDSTVGPTFSGLPNPSQV